MTDLAILGWTMAIAAVVAFGAWVIWLTNRYLTDRLMRCPETGAVTLVRAEEHSRPGGNATKPVVQWCELWPERKDCAQGCLARYDETEPGFKINLYALRPFERP